MPSLPAQDPHPCWPHPKPSPPPTISHPDKPHDVLSKWVRVGPGPLSTVASPGHQHGHPHLTKAHSISTVKFLLRGYSYLHRAACPNLEDASCTSPRPEGATLRRLMNKEKPQQEKILGASGVRNSRSSGVLRKTTHCPCGSCVDRCRDSLEGAP